MSAFAAQFSIIPLRLALQCQCVSAAIAPGALPLLQCLLNTAAGAVAVPLNTITRRGRGAEKD